MTRLPDSIKCVLLDLDGTVYHSTTPIPGAIEAIERLRRRFKVYFLTNNTSRSKADYVQKLNDMGIRAVKEDFHTAGDATLDYLKRNFDGKRIYLFGTDSLKQEYDSSGINLCKDNPDLCVVSFNTQMDYEQLCRLCTHIREGVPFIATHPDINCPIEGGYIPDVGAFLALIKSSTGKEPQLICGKPEQTMADSVKHATGFFGGQIAMIGDRIMTDIAFAYKNGFYGVLTLSGEGTEQALQASGYTARAMVKSIAEIE